MWRTLHDMDRLPVEELPKGPLEAVQIVPHGHNGGSPLEDAETPAPAPCPADAANSFLSICFHEAAGAKDKDDHDPHLTRAFASLYRAKQSRCEGGSLGERLRRVSGPSKSRGATSTIARPRAGSG